MEEDLEDILVSYTQRENADQHRQENQSVRYLDLIEEDEPLEGAPEHDQELAQELEEPGDVEGDVEGRQEAEIKDVKSCSSKLSQLIDKYLHFWCSKHPLSHALVGPHPTPRSRIKPPRSNFSISLPRQYLSDSLILKFCYLLHGQSCVVSRH